MDISFSDDWNRDISNVSTKTLTGIHLIHQCTLADEWWRNFNNSLLNVTCNDFGFAFVQLLTRQKILYHFYHQSNVETMLIRFFSGKLIQHRLVCLLKKLCQWDWLGCIWFYFGWNSLWQLKQTEYRHSKRRSKQRKLCNICSLPIGQNFKESRISVMLPKISIFKVGWKWG